MFAFTDLDDYKLPAEFDRPQNAVSHRFDRIDWRRGRRKIVTEDRWVYDDGILGVGAFGSVRLQKLQSGKSETRVKERAVKELRKLDMGRRNVDFRKEILALVKFSRPKFVQSQAFVEFFGWFEDDLSIYIAMEYLQHGTLEKFINEAISERDAQIIAHQLLDGLEIMHEERFTHRDLKPQNIFVVHPGPKWWVKIGDFGVSKRVPTEDTALRTTTGTPIYLAPEVSHFISLPDEESSQYTNAVDIWSFACVVYQLLALTPPFVDWPRSLVHFCQGGEFPEDRLRGRTSLEGIEFMKSVLIAFPQKRPSAKRALESSWFQTRFLDETLEGTLDTLPTSEQHRAVVDPSLLITQCQLGPDGKKTEHSTVQMHVPHPDPTATETHISRGRLVTNSDLDTLTVAPGLCGGCLKKIYGSFYRCTICNNGCYELCASCVEVGRHCRHENHWLVKRTPELDNTIGLPTEIRKTGWSLKPMEGVPEKEVQDHSTILRHASWKRSYPTSTPGDAVYDYCYLCRTTFRSDIPPRRHEWELHDTLDRPKDENTSPGRQREVVDPGHRWVKGVNEEEQAFHTMRLEQMEKEMTRVFKQKAAEKEEKMRASEKELAEVHKRLKADLEQQLSSLREKKARLELERLTTSPPPQKRRGFWSR